MQKMQIKLSENCACLDFLCCICGDVFQAEPVIADAFVDGREYDVVCKECVKGGPKKMRKRMIKRAESLRREAELLRREAEDIERLASQAIIECPTWADWKKLEEKVISEFDRADNSSVQEGNESRSVKENIKRIDYQSS